MPKLAHINSWFKNILGVTACTLGLVFLFIILGLCLTPYNPVEVAKKDSSKTQKDTTLKYLEVFPKYSVSIESNPYLVFSEIEKANFNVIEVPIERIGYHYWSRFTLEKMKYSSNTEYIEIQLGTADELNLHVPLKNGIYTKYELGLNFPKVNNTAINSLSSVFLETKTVDFERPFYVRNRPMSIFGLKALYTPIKVSLYNAKPYLLSIDNKNRYRKDRVYDFWFYTLFGIVFSVFLFAVIRYFLTYSLNYLLYAAYLFFLGLNTIHRIFIFQEILTSWHPHLYFYLNQLGAVFGIFFHTLFTFYFVNVRKNYPKLVLFYLVFLYTQIVFYVAYFALIVFFPYYKFHEIIIDTQIFTLVAINGFLVIYMMYTKRMLHTTLILIGSLMLIIGNFFAVLCDNTFILMPIVTLESILFITVFSYLDKIQYKKAFERDKLEELNVHKSKMFANITHEFRTPLTVILGMTDTLERDLKTQVTPPIKKAVDMIHRNGNNLLSMVNEMLALSKIESGSLELNMVQTNVIPFIKYLGESFHSFAQEKTIHFTVYSEIDALTMDIDSNKLSTIISNLLSNAIKFSSSLGKIIMHINNEKDTHLIIKVSDTGIGISEKELPHIFNRFYQADNAVTRKREGTGIGLSLTKELVNLLGGIISVKSVVNEGSTFKVELPITKKAPKKSFDSLKSTNKTSYINPTFKFEHNNTKKEEKELPLVLIIEDNKDVAYYISQCLEKNYKTIHTINGVLGLEKAFEKTPDIIISDVMMPGKDGYEICRILKEDERTDHIPIILLTAKVTPKDRVMGLKQGADAYLSKPFIKEELFIRLDQLLSLRKKMIAKFQQGMVTKVITKQPKSAETKFIAKAIDHIHNNIDNATFGSAQLSFKLRLSESQIYRKLKAITGKSTAVFIRTVRLEYAKEQLRNTDKTVSEVAFSVGFNDPSWFSRAFKEEFGFSPNERRK